MSLAEDAPAARIRSATAEDIPAITAIYAHHVRHGRASFEIEPPDEAEMRRRQAALLAQDMPYLVLERGGAVLGYAYAGSYRPRPAYRDTVENSIYVRADQAGRGFGRRLLTALIEACEARGLRQMVAVVGDSANAASIRLHLAMGFREVGVLRAVGWKHGRWLDSVLLQRALGPGEATPPDARP
ncbi:N-acetyltransferase family protein [Roseomonas sp. M0104]|uniref:N-acetyltransferase family protein n=1 Tax=Teichococcus coralli TaxID=2545983 RepID=A0A845BFF8_9PROT|nr:GNAT family N-acetyltransferase [Pseudoroseomonas coralli]MXP64846.1 N-acetyltransferase family protein [Pseudoroseomonas coralli]